MPPPDDAQRASTDPVADPNQTGALDSADPRRSTDGVLQTIMDLSQGRQFGKYQIVRRIGQGAMGNVFEVLNRTFDPHRREAMKVIRSKWRSVPDAVQRFLAEVGRAASLIHSNIVTVFAFGEHDGEVFYTMSIVDGGDLGELILREKKLEPRRAAELVRLVAGAVEEAHRQKVIHRDLKPSNILLRPDGTPLVTDFGLAVLMSPSAGSAATGSGPEGTPCYMPPEQAEARHADIGPRSDVYALGAILYECLTGRPPFKGRDVAETLRLVRNAPVDPPRVWNRAVPRDLEAVCLKCLEKEPAKRYASAGELAAALEKFLDRGQRRPMTRRQKLALMLGVVVVLLLLFAGAQVWQQEEIKSYAKGQADHADELRKESRSRQALDQYAVALERYDALLSRWMLYGRTDARVARAVVQLARGILQEGQRDYDGARSALEAAQSELEDLRPARANDPRFLNLLAEVYHNLGVHYSDNRYARAERERGREFYDKAIRLRDDVYERFPGNRDYDRDRARSYGYLGDVLLELDQAEGAERAYAKAETIRDRLAKAPDADIVALCLHARDFSNRSNLNDWKGSLAHAITAARDRVRYYQDRRFQARLPGEFLLDPASALVTVAELELDRPEGLTPERMADVLKMLKDALTKIQSAGETTDDQKSEFTSELIWVYTTLGKGYFLKGDWKEARIALEKGNSLFSSDRVDDKRSDEKRNANDYYHRAQAHALLAKLGTEADEKKANLADAKTYLKQAIKKGFRHYYRVTRDQAFDDLRAADDDSWFTQNVVEPIMKDRPQLIMKDRPQLRRK